MGRQVASPAVVGHDRAEFGVGDQPLLTQEPQVERLLLEVGAAARVPLDSGQGRLGELLGRLEDHEQVVAGRVDRLQALAGLRGFELTQLQGDLGREQIEERRRH